MNEEYISSEGLYKMLHCSKRKAKYLLDNGIIPCENTGKKTWRYKVKKDNVIIYLENVRHDPNQYYFPAGVFSSKSPTAPVYSIELSGGDCQRLRRIISNALAGAPDALTVEEASAVTGYSTTFFIRIIQSGDLHAEKISAHYIIPKEKLIRFLAGKNGIDIKYKSAFHKKMLQILIERKTKNEKDDTKTG